MEKDQVYRRLSALWREAHREYLAAEIVFDQIEHGGKQAAFHLSMAWSKLARLADEERGNGAARGEFDLDQVAGAINPADLEALPVKYRETWRDKAAAVFKAGNNYWKREESPEPDDQLIYEQLAATRRVLQAGRRRLARTFDMSLLQRARRHYRVLVVAAVVAVAAGVFLLKSPAPLIAPGPAPAPVAAPVISPLERAQKDLSAVNGEIGVINRALRAEKPELDALFKEREQLIANRRRVLDRHIAEQGPAGKWVIEQEIQLQQRLEQVLNLIKTARTADLAPERERLSAQLQLLKAQKAELEKPLKSLEDVKQLNRATWPRVAELEKRLEEMLAASDGRIPQLVKRRAELTEQVQQLKEQAAQ